MSTVTQLPMSDLATRREGGPVAPMGDDEIISLQRMLEILRRRKWLIAGIVFVITSLATLYVNQITPIYMSETLLVVEGNRQNVVDIESVVQGIRPDYYTNETEAAVIASRTLARRAVMRLDLANDPLFNPDLRPPPPGLLKSLLAPVIAWFASDDAAGSRSDESRSEPARPAATADAFRGLDEDERADLIEYVVDGYLSGLSVLPANSSRVITVRYTSTNPYFAAVAANTSAQIYIADQLAAKGEATGRASVWLNDRAMELRRRVIESEQRLQEFRAESGIVEVEGATIYARQLAQLNSQLIVARTRRAEAEARYDQVQSLLSSEGGIETAAAVLDSALIQRLREQEAQILRKIAELNTQLRDGHPRMILARNELKDWRTKIASEVGKIVNNLGNELEIAMVRESNLQTEVTRLEKQLTQQKGASVALHTLESEVRANKQLYETILGRFKETKVQDDELQQADARIISKAVTPAGPFYPRKNVMIMAAFMASIFVAIAIAFGLEFIDSGFRGVDQVENLTGFSVLALLPMLNSQDRRSGGPHQFALDKPNSTFGEALRTLRTGLLLSSAGSPPKSVMIASSVPGEGKTSTSLSFAMTASRAGQRCILLDCDLRHPSLHTAIDFVNDRGLSDYLAGNSGIDDVIEIDPRTGLHFITAGSRAPNPTDLLGSPQMRALLERLSHLYDLVVLDSSPLLAVSDALVLMRQVDRVVFLIRWEKTRRETALLGIRQIIEAGGDLAGTVLTQVNMRKHGRYDYADAGYYYYGSYKKYYSE